MAVTVNIYHQMQILQPSLNATGMTRHVTCYIIILTILSPLEGFWRASVHFPEDWFQIGLHPMLLCEILTIWLGARALWLAAAV